MASRGNFCLIRTYAMTLFQDISQANLFTASTFFLQNSLALG